MLTAHCHRYETWWIQTFPFKALHYTRHIRLGWSCLNTETHSKKPCAVLEWIWRSHDVWRFLCTDRWKLASSGNDVHQHSLTPFCDIMWPTTFCLIYCFFQLLPFCDKATESGLWNISKYYIYFVVSTLQERIHLIAVSYCNFLSSWELPIL